jgi:hypothetical protein
MHRVALLAQRAEQAIRVALQVLEVDLQPLEVGQRVLHDGVWKARPERHTDGQEGQAQGSRSGIVGRPWRRAGQLLARPKACTRSVPT